MALAGLTARASEGEDRDNGGAHPIGLEHRADFPARAIQRDQTGRGRAGEVRGWRADTSGKAIPCGVLPMAKPLAKVGLRPPWNPPTLPRLWPVRSYR